MSKFRKGQTIRSPGLALSLIADGHHLYWHNKCQNAGWLQNMTIHTIRTAVMTGIIAFAHPRGETE